MNWAKVSSIAEILSSVAIILTLIYLAVEIRQNTRAIQAGARDSVVTADLQLLSEMIENPDLMLNRVADSLSDEDRVRLASYLVSFVRVRERDWRQFNAGALDESTWRSFQSGLLTTLSYPNTRRWWDNSSFAFPEDFRSYVDELLTDQEVSSRLAPLSSFD